MNSQNQLKPGKKIKNYVLSKLIGEGAFGTVWEGINLNNNEICAIKILPKKLFRENKKVKELFDTECRVLKYINNPNVVRYFDEFETVNNSYLVLEYCNEGDMEEYVKKKKSKRIPEEEALEYFKQMLNGFKGLHEFKVIHRDLKLANILRHNGTLKIADLGFAKELKSDKDLVKTILGTSLTMAPEVLDAQKYGMEADVYSLGVIFYQMLFGTYPFIGMSDPELLNNIRTKPLVLEKNDVKISPLVKDLLRQMIEQDRNKRISWQGVYKHQVFNQLEESFVGGMGHLGKSIGLQDLTQSNQVFQQNKIFYEQHEMKIEEIFKWADEKKIEEVDEGEQSDEEQKEFSDTVLKNVYENKQIEMDIKLILQKYLNERNVYSQLAKAILQCHLLPETQINTFVPCFYLIKKLLILNESLIESIKKNENIFNCKYFAVLLKNDMFQTLLQKLEQDHIIIELYFIDLQSEVSKILKKMSNPNQKIGKELEREKSQFFEEIYKETLLNYYSCLSEDREFHKLNENKKLFTTHMIQILDCMNLEQIFKSEPIFEFGEYNLLLEKYTPEEKEYHIEQRFTLNFQQ